MEAELSESGIPPMDPEDAFWAAKQVAAFTDDEIRAIVETGEFSDQRAADWIAECLIRRRDKIATAWFGKVLPLDNFRVAGGKLAFDDLSRYAAGMQLGYEITWASYDNNRGVARNCRMLSAGNCRRPAMPPSIWPQPSATRVNPIPTAPIRLPST